MSQFHPEDRRDLLRRTLASLKVGGWDAPTIFLDCASHRQSQDHEDEFGLEVVSRKTPMRTYGNWILAMWELWIRNPHADRYCIFQDDLVVMRNLRAWLSTQRFPEMGYWNLYTSPRNQALTVAPSPGQSSEGRLSPAGWFRSDQLGKGALALVFDRKGVMDLLSSRHMVEKPASADHRFAYRNVDGGVSDSLCRRPDGNNYTEWCHDPTLVQHTGTVSTSGNLPKANAVGWLGESFDAMSLPR